MSSPPARLLRLGIICLGAVLLAYVVIRPGGSSPTVDRPGDGSASASSAVVAFGPVPASGTGVVRTAGGAVLPVTGGSDGAWQVLTPCAHTAVVDGPRLGGAHVVLDPGHGGRETGAVGPGGLVEADLNLDVARRAAAMLEDAGATVALTRDADLRVTLATRAAVAEALRPLAFISIHHNSGPTHRSSRPGVQVYHQHRRSEAGRLGRLLWEQLRHTFGSFSTTFSAGNATGVRARLGTDGADYYGVLRDAPDVPAVLVEALYLSSEPEATLLTRADVRDAEARAIADAVTAWLTTDRDGSGELPPLEATESAGGGGGTKGCVDPPGLTG